MPAGRWGARMGEAELVDPVVGGLTDPFNRIHMGVTAENVAERYGITREEQDEFALTSHMRAKAAIEAGRFDDEVVPVPIKVKRQEVGFTEDEHVRKDATLENLGKLPTVFKRDGGTVTAGNASGMNDAGAAVVLMHENKAKELGAPVRARIVSWAYCGVEPKIMGVGPVPATRRALERAGMTLDDVDVIELNEAFASQALAVIRDLGMDRSKVNPNGGAIAIGHPLGASGTRLIGTLAYEMQRRDAEWGLVTLCMGAGMGMSLALQREHYDW